MAQIPPILRAVLKTAEVSDKASPSIPASQRIARLLEALDKLPANEAAIAPLASAFVEGLKADYTLNTTALALTRARRAIVAKFGESHPAYALLLSGPAAAKIGRRGVGLTALETDVRRQNDRKRVNAYRRHQVSLTEGEARKLVRTARAMIATSLTFDSPRHRSFGLPRWDIIMAGLLLLTGRRPFEISYLGSFASVKGKPRWTEFAGQAKTRDAANAQTSPYQIPVLAPASEIIAAFTTLRLAFPAVGKNIPRDRAAEAVHDLYKTDLGATVHAYFPQWRARDLRALYGSISYHAYAPTEMAYAVWLSDVLGHATLADDPDATSEARKADTLTAAYYERFYIPTLSRSDRLRLS